MAFYPGQEVECINDNWNKHKVPRIYANDLHPVKGNIYTVLGIGNEHPELKVICIGIVGFEHWYASSHFRPIQKKKTDISFAYEILNKTTKKQKVRA